MSAAHAVRNVTAVNLQVARAETRQVHIASAAAGPFPRSVVALTGRRRRCSWSTVRRPTTPASRTHTVTDPQRPWRHAWVSVRGLPFRSWASTARPGRPDPHRPPYESCVSPYRSCVGSCPAVASDGGRFRRRRSTAARPPSCAVITAAARWSGCACDRGNDRLASASQARRPRPSRSRSWSARPAIGAICGSPSSVEACGQGCEDRSRRWGTAEGERRGPGTGGARRPSDWG